MMNRLKSFKSACFVIVCLFLHVEFVASASARRESHTLTLTVDPGTVVNINRTSADGSQCTVCVVEAGQSCQPEAVLTNPGPVSVTFGCSAPWEIFTVEIVKKLECKKKPCQHTVTAKDSASLLRFNRTLHWCLRAPVRMTFHVAFLKTGLAQIQPRHTCPDQHTYNLVALESTKNVHLGSFCANGTVTGVQILNGGKVVLTVPGGTKMEPRAFDVYWGEDIKSLAVVNVKLPRGQSSQEFFSANYPSSFPDDDLMTWNFSVPRHHDSTVKFLKYSVPHCRKKEPSVEYEQAGKREVLKLSEPQLTGERDPFELTLTNCEMDVKRSRADAVGLTLHFMVSAIRTGSEVLCTVDFTKEDSLALHIAKAASDSTCKLKLEGVIKDSVTLLPGKKSTLSFKDCPEENLLLTVNKTITFRDTLLPSFAACEFENLANCPTRPVPLTVPALERCLPESLKTIHWNLQAPEDGTVELWAFSGTLRQSLPGQECNGSVEFRVAEGDGTEIGEFCTSGAISEIQIHSNVTVTATPRDDPFLSDIFQTFFKVTFTKEIRETYVFWVKLGRNTPSRLLASPGWPGGMKPDATASWITQVPDKTDAELILTKVTQPKCQDGHTIMQVQTKESQESLYSRREDEEGESEITIHESFYLNMSNCRPETGHFSAMWETKLAKPKRLLLPIILAVVGALLLVTLIALVVVCVVVRKKKQEMAEDAAQRGVYNPNGHMFLPGLHGPPKTVEEDDDAHIYDYIEDTLVYGHLLQDKDDNNDRYGEPIAMDAYKPSNGTSETTPLKAKEANGDGGGEAEVGVYRPFVPLSEGITTTTATTTQEDQKTNMGQSEGGLGGGEGRRSPEPLSPCSEALQVQQVPVDV